MQKNHRKGRSSTKTSIEDEIAHLRGLDLGGLRARWQSVFQRHAPAHLTRHLLIAVIAYRLQVDRFGDLDHATKQVLDRAIAKEPGPVPGMSARLASLDQKRTGLTPGTMLVREWDRQSQRVMVMADGFAWNGQTYDSLSKVAFAITGTRWNGPRFFGLRDKDDQTDHGNAVMKAASRQTGPLCDLYPCLHRARTRPGVQLAGRAIRCRLRLYQEPGPCRLDPDPVAL